VAHELLYSLVSDLAERVDLTEPIVEFGSMQVESGQPNDLRPLFEGRRFIGTDLREGPGVDRVEDLRELSFADGEVGTAVCLDTLEHCADPFAACREMRRVLADVGVCIITSVMMLGIHAHPNDYWRFTPEGFRVLLDGFEGVDVAGVGDPGHPFFVFGIGAKGEDPGVRLADLPSLSSAQRRYELAVGELRVGPFRYTPGELAAVISRELPRALRQRVAARLGR
jgi:Methyltransferase domain